MSIIPVPLCTCSRFSTILRSETDGQSPFLSCEYSTMPSSTCRVMDTWPVLKKEAVQQCSWSISSVTSQRQLCNSWPVWPQVSYSTFQNQGLPSIKWTSNNNTLRESCARYCFKCFTHYFSNNFTMKILLVSPFADEELGTERLHTLSKVIQLVNRPGLSPESLAPEPVF